jgi:hypothetical protein
MLETSANGAGAAIDGAAAGREDERAVGELGFGAGGRAARAGVPGPSPTLWLCLALSSRRPHTRIREARYSASPAPAPLAMPRMQMPARKNLTIALPQGST